ncbi:MAG: phosphate acyltransferase PlsX [Clostridiales bacterium]|nr:phosphate acyltransferase PlsX [Clostridiales bacterium]
MVKIVMDCLGGDHSPDANVEGSLRAMDLFPDLYILFTGDETALTGLLKASGADVKYAGRYEIVHAPGVITGEDKPTDAIRLKKDASMIRAIRILREDPSVSAMVSAGATGALVAAATLRIGRIRGIRRPAFCPVLPTMNGGIVGICDTGANVDITPEYLQQYAVMGSMYLQKVYGIRDPRVALLNIGTESEKGDDLRKQAYLLLKETPGINFVGNMESRDLLSGKYDLVVCDGFAGNVLVKTTEGTSLELLKRLRKDMMSDLRSKIGALFLKHTIMKEVQFMNYQNYGGSVLLGCEKTVVKGHGSSRPEAICKCIEQAYRMETGRLNEELTAAVRALYGEE